MQKLNFRDCPLCEMELRSDATINKFCKLCGMGIIGQRVPIIRLGDKKFYFCSERCRTTYSNEIVKKQNLGGTGNNKNSKKVKRFIKTIIAIIIVVMFMRH